MSQAPGAAEESPHEYIFGFGSIINSSTHAPWVAELNNSEKDAGRTVGLPGQRATISPGFGYQRGWNFRSNTGFTALGMIKSQESMPINGVVFQIKRSMLDGFDRREVGYDRVPIPLKYMDLSPMVEESSNENTNPVILEIKNGENVWVYVPQQSFCAEANEDHPILQSYVDTVLQGCLEWGGEEMAAEFIATTQCWSRYYLNDTPSSRRPWLFRKQYHVIDALLNRNPSTHFAERRHPEEFASAFLIKMMRGSWSVPRRNVSFTGRENEIGKIHAKLIAQRTDEKGGGVSKLEVSGMGGVGKSQLCTEYCYRYFPSYYGLVIWLNAQSAEGVASSYRQLMADTTGVDVQDKDTDEVVAEVKARLFRSTVPWLLVFDNLEDHSLLDKFVPHGGICGHVLVTTRLVAEGGEQTTMALGCFSPEESVELLCRSADICSEAHVSAATELANHLGHLPLALSMAAAYMKQCDVDSSEYLNRYISSNQSLGRQSVTSSLSLSLNAIKEKSEIAWKTLRLLGWLGPDQITKSLLRELLRARTSYIEATAATEARVQQRAKMRTNLICYVSGSALIGCLTVSSHFLLKSQSKGRRNFGVLVNLIAAISLGAATAAFSWSRSDPNEALSSPESRTRRITNIRLAGQDEFGQADFIWTILKSFSLLTVKDAKGSMHRLLAQALRESQSDSESRQNLEICILAITQAWTFKPEQVSTWKSAASILEHLKTVVSHSLSHPDGPIWASAVLSREAGVFSAMALNRFEEAKDSLEQSLEILELCNEGPSEEQSKARAAALFEIGRVLRYQGDYEESEEALQKSLDIRNSLTRIGSGFRHQVASTLHELGVLEVKKHNLDLAAKFLESALELRSHVVDEADSERLEADCAATLHQLAAVHVARKPPKLDEAEHLLNEALVLNMQIGQRAATLKQLARIAIRRGEFDNAEKSLASAESAYVELYGDSTLHINLAAVKFQQGALSLQRERYEQAWEYFSDCLQTRRHVYSYLQGNHLEVSSVLHELSRVAFAQNRIEKAQELLRSEREILDQLFTTPAQHQRILQSCLTNLTWLRKCAKELGNDEEARRIAAERKELKSKEKGVVQVKPMPARQNLQREALRCRTIVRQFALEDNKSALANVKEALQNLSRKAARSDTDRMRLAVMEFHKSVSGSLVLPAKQRKSTILNACDILRDVLREHGVRVNDSVQNRKTLQ